MTPRLQVPKDVDRAQLLIVVGIMLVLMFTIGIVPAVMPWRASA